MFPGYIICTHPYWHQVRYYQVHEKEIEMNTVELYSNENISDFIPWWRVLIAFWSFVWKTLLDDRPKPHVCKFHMKSANPWISMKFKIWICGFLSKNLQISLESADFSEIHSYLSDFNRETSKRKTTCIADNPLHLQDIVQRSLICVLLLVENMHNLATGCMLLRTNKIGITLRLNIRFL